MSASRKQAPKVRELCCDCDEPHGPHECRAPIVRRYTIGELIRMGGERKGGAR